METFTPFDSFSQLHSYVYSIIALQELNIYYHYNPVYWNIGCLTVEATPDEEGSGSGSVDYGEVAKAIYKMKKHGVNIKAPNIQLSNLEFTPNAKNNEILYGLGAISGINNDIANQIISNRPYTSFADFYTKNAYQGSLITNSKFITLIKSGCFDVFDSNRIKVMKQYIVLSTPKKTALTMANLPEAIRIGAKPPKQLLAPYNFKRYVCNKQFLYGTHPNFKSKKLYWLDDRAMRYFNANCIHQLKEDTDWWVNDEGMTVVVDKALDKLFAPVMDELKTYINTPEYLDKFNRRLYNSNYNNLLPNQDPNHWSFEATSFYSQEHELANIDKDRYNIVPFDCLPEEPEFITRTWGKREWKQYSLSRIAGVVIARNDNNHLLTILDMNNNVVQCKFDAFHYAKYKQQISVPDNRGGKTVVDPSWFTRGQALILSGVRMGENEFRVKSYKNSIFNTKAVKIVRINNETGELELQYDRYGESEDDEK